MSRDICDRCRQKEEDDFLTVRDYLRTHPGATIPEVAEKTEVLEATIQHFINSGRLERVGAQLSHTCQTCGATIQSGLICQPCSQRLQDEVKKLRGSIAAKKDAARPTGHSGRDDDGMHIKKRG